MDISLILARIMGITMILVYGGFLKNKQYYSGFVRSISENPILLFISGFISILLGLIVIQVHNIWTWDFRGFITLLGWVLLLSGIFRIFFPKQALYLSEKTLRMSNAAMNTLCIFFILIGLFLTYKGFSL